MTKQDQNRGKSPEERKKMQSIPQGSHKEKAPENLGHPEEQGYARGAKSSEAKPSHQQENKPTHHPSALSRPPKSFDRDEGQGHSQKP